MTDTPAGGPGPQGSDPADNESSPDTSSPDIGGDAVRAALARARAAATERGEQPGEPGRARSKKPRRTGRKFSGAGPDARDPQLLGDAVQRLVREAGWQTPVSVGGVFGRWDQIVGAQVAEHAVPESFEGGKLVIRTSSTAWATQLRLLRTKLMSRLTAELGSGVVTEIVVRGPTAPSWRHGPRSAGGRGPRDTYG